MQIAHVKNFPLDLYIGNYHSCDALVLRPNAKRICIWHEKQPGHCSNKNCEYLEHMSLTEELIQKTIEIAQQAYKEKSQLLVHCAAGLGRTPTFALLTLTAVGISPWDAMGPIAEAMWTQYAIPHAPSWDCKVLNQIFEKELWKK